MAGLFLFGTSGCGGGLDTKAADAQITKLLPDGTAAVVRLASLDSMNDLAASFAAVGGAPDEDVDVRDLLALAPIPLGDVRLIEGTLPIAIAVTSKRATPATVTLIVPTTDPEKYTKSLGNAGITPTMAGNYAAVPLFGNYKPSEKPSQIMANMMPSDISIHGDVGTLAKNYKLIIDSGLDMLVKTMTAELERTNPGIDGEPIAEMYASVGRAIAESTETLDIGIDFANGALDFYSTLDVRDGTTMSGWSSPASDLEPLARGLTGDKMLEVIFQMDMDKLAPRYDAIINSMIEVYPAEFQEPMQQLMAAYKDIYKLLNDGIAVEGDIFGDDGIALTMQMAPPDPAALVAQMTTLLQSEPMQKIGLTIKDSKTGEDGATKTSDLVLGFDIAKFAAMLGEQSPEAPIDNEALFEAMFGNGFSLHTAHRDGRLVITSGLLRGEVAKKTLAASSGSWSEQLQPAMDRVRDCNPVVVERIDFGKMMAAMSKFMAGPKVPANAAADMLFYGGVRDNQWRFGMSLDIKGMAAMFGSMSPR